MLPFPSSLDSTNEDAVTMHRDACFAWLHCHAQHRECLSPCVYTFDRTYKARRLHVGQEKVAAIATHVLG